MTNTVDLKLSTLNKFAFQSLKEAMKVAIEYAESKLGAKMVQIGAGDAKATSTTEVTDSSDFEVVNKSGADLKEGPVLHCRIGTPIANMILVTASYAKFNVQQSQIGKIFSC